VIIEIYRNSGGNSGVSTYQIGSDFIIVKFSGTASPYKYSYQKAGQSHVENLKQLARRGSGLNSYIYKYVKNLYD
jgi:hypothetical protein